MARCPELATLGPTPELDAAGHSWATLTGASGRTVTIGSHLDSVPNGGWLDGALGVIPVVLMFASSSHGLSHCTEEDTPEPHREKTITAFLRLVEKTVHA